ncbi:ribosomal protein S18 acetylase RimI-like enzyme [Kushneria sinocarnis]|uniref:Ribosomal protein S18 acetylase RimI-like enzyme n=1 Tax=Kushneria sinocarnis TaxID=595502 RepID=A0A420WZM4_9GAMM|nr:GNAT family N-acetyltransferase [Kushneria sinocarnis]RKR06808.1 ribosomal protein S18 acetylase RimI-like enzyme [Kushneria sinocarnis]
MSLTIRAATDEDFEAIWAIFRPILEAGETYALDPGMSAEQGRGLWLEAPRASFVAEREGEILGSYYLKANFGGNGSHVANCGYIVADAARGQGIAGEMCRHSLTMARELGFTAMQYNSVIATNEGAIRLWQRHGFDIVGRLPGAFRHPRQGAVDALVMYRVLN